MIKTLFYVMDPMCSWCWGFAPALRQLLNVLDDTTRMQYVMGGLAPDSDEPMPEETREYVKQQWRLVFEQTGAEFNWDFWGNCQPRRSTYPACRAVIAAGKQGEHLSPKMIFAIQHAYYEQARNPSDTSTLLQLATELGLDFKQFSSDINSEKTQKLLQQDFTIRSSLGAEHFPSLFLETEEGIKCLSAGYTDSATLLKRYFTIVENQSTR